VSASSSAARFASIRALRSISARLRRGFGLVHRASRGRLPEPRRARASPLGGSPRSTSTPSKRQSAPAKSLPGAEPWGSMALMAISAQPLEKVNFGGNGAATPVRGWMIQTCSGASSIADAPLEHEADSLPFRGGQFSSSVVLNFRQRRRSAPWVCAKRIRGESPTFAFECERNGWARHVMGRQRRAIPADAYLPSVTCSRRKGQGTESGYYE